MRLLVGLGNPGAEYAGTRHNVGFEIVDRTAAEQATPRWSSRFLGLACLAVVGGERVLCLKPQTFMNRSGASVLDAARHYDIAPSDVLVAHDDLDLGFGVVRLKLGGGDGGHRGIRSIAAELGPDFRRLRFGIGRPPPEFPGDVTDFVLQAFAPEERAALDERVAQAARVVASVVHDGLAQAMNSANRRNA